MEASQGTGRFTEPNPGRMGRKKIQISRIGDERNRQVGCPFKSSCKNAFGS